MAEIPEKANIQGIEIHLVKINNNGWKYDRASLGRRQTGWADPSLTDPKKGHTDKRMIVNVDRQSDVSTAKKNIHGHMTPDEP